MLSIPSAALSCSAPFSASSKPLVVPPALQAADLALLLAQCALASPVPERLVDTVLTLLGSGFDPARRNAAQFLAIALRARCIVAEFDRQGGLRRLLAVLRATLVLLTGPSNDVRMDKQVRRASSRMHISITSKAQSRLYHCGWLDRLIHAMRV